MRCKFQGKLYQGIIHLGFAKLSDVESGELQALFHQMAGVGGKLRQAGVRPCSTALENDLTE